MKLSILIPTYNQDCTRLVHALHRQMPEEVEIVVADDGSCNTQVRQSNRSLAQLKNVVYWESEHNMGRARIRNRLTQMAQSDYLLFIDSDALVEREDFLGRYLQCLPTDAVVCGGIVHPAHLPSPSVSLRWKYEKSCEPRFTAARRNQAPYDSLRTFNIMIPRKVALAHPFDETITRYGYEDTLLGKELADEGIAVLHIDNPLVNGDIETNDVFLQKTEEAMKTLYDIRERIADKSRLLETYNRLNRCALTPLVAFVFRHTQALMRLNLTGNHPCIQLFNLYKLGFYCNLSRSKK